MHNLDDKHPTRPGFEPRTSEMCSVKFVISSGLCVSTIYTPEGRRHKTRRINSILRSAIHLTLPLSWRCTVLACCYGNGWQHSVNLHVISDGSFSAVFTFPIASLYYGALVQYIKRNKYLLNLLQNLNFHSLEVCIAAAMHNIRRILFFSNLGQFFSLLLIKNNIMKKILTVIYDKIWKMPSSAVQLNIITIILDHSNIPISTQHQ